MNHLTRALAVLALTAGIAAAQEGSVGYTPGQRGTAEGLRAWLAEFAPRALAAQLQASQSVRISSARSAGSARVCFTSSSIRAR